MFSTRFLSFRHINVFLERISKMCARKSDVFMQDCGKTMMNERTFTVSRIKSSWAHMKAYVGHLQGFCLYMIILLKRWSCDNWRAFEWFEIESGLRFTVARVFNAAVMSRLTCASGWGFRVVFSLILFELARPRRPQVHRDVRCDLRTTWTGFVALNMNFCPVSELSCLLLKAQPSLK